MTVFLVCVAVILILQAELKTKAYGYLMSPDHVPSGPGKDNICMFITPL